MMFSPEQLSALLPLLGEAGIKAIMAEVDELVAQANEPWKKALLGLVANGVAVYGPQGLLLVENTLDKLLASEPVNLDWADLEVSSDILAVLQNAEAGRKIAAKDFLNRVGKVLGQITGGILKGLIAAL